MKIINPYRFGSNSTLTTGLEGWWGLEESSGTRTDSVNGYTLTEEGGTISSTTGKISNGAAMVTADGYHFLNTGNNIGAGSTMTLSIWLKLTSAGTTQWLYDWGGGRDTYIQGSLIRWRSTGGTKVSAVTLSSSTWYHVVLTYSRNDQLQIIINNGTPETIATADGDMPSADLWIGERTSSASSLGGVIDEFAWWSRVLTAEEITELYNSGNGIGYPG